MEAFCSWREVFLPGRRKYFQVGTFSSRLEEKVPGGKEMFRMDNFVPG